MSVSLKQQTAAASGRLDHGYEIVAFRRRGFSGFWSRRATVVGAGTIVAAIVLLLIALGSGTYPLSPGEVINALLGKGSQRSQLLVVGWRLPRAVFALACGVALAVSGAIFQSLTRNSLGSPDIIGFSSGSYTGAVVMLLGIGSSRYLDVAAASLVGGCLTATIVYLLATKRGSVQSFRLIIMGIGVAALLSSFNSTLLLFVDSDTAMLAAVWAAGSLNGLGYEQLLPMLVLLVVMLFGIRALLPSVNQLELGDDYARATGVRTNTVRAGAVVIGVGLTALVTAAAGPISFVALAAPQIARWLTRSSVLALVPTALVGAVLLLASDILAQKLGFPVGVLTASLGGTYLVCLLAVEFRRRSTS